MSVEVSIMSSRGQVVVPKSIRKELGLKEGDAIAFTSSTGKLVAEKLKTPSKEELLMRWNKMTKEWNKRAIALGIKEEDVGQIIHRRRGIKD